MDQTNHRTSLPVRIVGQVTRYSYRL